MSPTPAVAADLSTAQRLYVSRACILAMLEDYVPIAIGDDPDIWSADDLAAAKELAESDLDKARATMEDEAAFGHLMAEQSRQFPGVPKLQLQKSVRALISDPATRSAAAEASGVYERMGFDAEVRA